MPEPKRKTSKQRRNNRNANKGIKPGAVMKCLTCQAPIVPHVVCAECGYYKGKKILKTKSDKIQKRNEALQAKQQTATPTESAK